MRLNKLERKLKNGCDMSDRKNKITKILLNAMYPTEESFNGAVESFSKSKLSLQEIESLAKTMTPEYQASARDFNNRQTRRAGVF